jgi:hypothetical protein
VQYLYDHDLFPEEPNVTSRPFVPAPPASRLTPRTAALLLALTVSPAQSLAQTVPLRYVWKQGDVITYRTVVRTASHSTGGPAGPAAFEQTLSQTVKVTVAAVDVDGTATLRQSIEAVSMEVTNPMGKVAYDSAKPPGQDADPRAQVMAKSIGGMVGEAISVTMATTGAVRRIDGAARIVEKLMTNLPRDPMAGGMAQNIKAMLSDDALRSSLEQSFPRMPDAAVKIGDTWTSEQSVGADAIGRVIGKSTFTLKAIEGAGDAAVARIAVSLALRQESVPTAGASAAMKLGADSKGEGEVIFSIARGRVDKNSMRTDMPATVTMRGPDGPMTLQNNTKTTMTMEVVR